MQLQEYIDSIEDEYKKDLVHKSLAAMTECIEFSKVERGRPHEELHFSVYEDAYIQAGASEYNKLISFSTGLVDHYFESKYPNPYFIMPEAPLVVVTNLVMDIGLAWSLSHEYVHIYRCHDSVSERISEAAQKDHSLVKTEMRAALGLSGEEISKALEHDADLCAIAKIYRFLQRRLGAYDDMIIRKMALFYLYWGFRTLPENEHSDSHPMLYERLYEIINKLGQLTRNQYQRKYVVGQNLNSHIKRSIELMELAVKLERIYINETKQKDETDAMWHKWLQYVDGREHTGRAKSWAKVSPWVEGLSGTLADNRKDVFFYKRKDQERREAERKKKRKLQRRARAKTRS